MMPPEARDLILRYCTLGTLLTRYREDVELVRNPSARAEVELILQEMDEVRAQITAAARAARRGTAVGAT
jgi:hypothetical protein